MNIIDRISKFLGEAKPMIDTHGKHIYTGGAKCPKCGSDKKISMNASMPILWQCVECGHIWNPDNEQWGK